MWGRRRVRTAMHPIAEQRGSRPRLSRKTNRHAKIHSQIDCRMDTVTTNLHLSPGTHACPRGSPINKRFMSDLIGDDVLVAVDADVVALLRAKFEAVLPHLDERQQRLVMAGETRALGHGGIAVVAQASGASRSRISAGVAELESGQPPLKRVRRHGGGRKALTATDPALLAALLRLVEPTRRGDPESPLCWTTLSTRKLAAELTAAGQKIGADTVAVLLREQGFSLQGNAKTMSLSRCLCKQVVDLVVGRRGSSALDGVPVLAAVKPGPPSRAWSMG
jgi:Rhodopirellula transposase DDE domain